MLSDSEMKSLIERIHEQLTFIYSKANYGEGADRSILHPPASSSELAALKASLAFTPSYRRFLEWHNGWEHFWLNMTLTGVSGKHTKAVQDKFAETVAWQTARLTEKLGGLTEDKIRDWERQSERNMYLPRHICLGTNFAADFYIFDKRSVRPDGEMRIAYWNIAWGAYDNPSYEDFGALLRQVAPEVEGEAKTYRKKATRTKKR